MEEINTNEQELNGPKGKTACLIKNKTEDYLKKKLEREGNGKSKVRHLMEGTRTWEAGRRREYMEKMNRKQCSIIFQSRTRMLPIKDNYRQKYAYDLRCRACGLQIETQNHILTECEELHKEGNTKIQMNEIFKEDTIELQETANKLIKTIEKLQNINQTSGAPQSQEAG